MTGLSLYRGAGFWTKARNEQQEQVPYGADPGSVIAHQTAKMTENNGIPVHFHFPFKKGQPVYLGVLNPSRNGAYQWCRPLYK